MLHPRQQSSTASTSFSDSPSPSSSSTSSLSDTSSTQSDSSAITSSTTTTRNDSSSFTPTTTTSTASTSTFESRSSSSPVSSSSFHTFTSDSSSSIPASLPTTPPPSSSSSTTSVPSAPSNGFTTFVSDINGVPTTVVAPVATSLHGSTSALASNRPAVIAGSAIGGLLLFIIGLSAIFLLRRRARRQEYRALSRKQLPSRSTFLAGESMDMAQPTSPFSYTDHDDPFATPFATTRITRGPSDGSASGGGSPPSFPHAHPYLQRPDSPFVRTASPVPSSPPRLFRPHASESGSIFQESVWPPPSHFTDPLTSPSHAVDLGSIVNEVMGPSPRTTTDESGESGGGSGRARDGSSGVSEAGPLLPPSDPEPDLGSVPTLTLTNPDPQSPLSPLQRPETPTRPPQWLSRSPNPSPKHSPLHSAKPL